jgi:hypothetical protein
MAEIGEASSLLLDEAGAPTGRRSIAEATGAVLFCTNCLVEGDLA